MFLAKNVSSEEFFGEKSSERRMFLVENSPAKNLSSEECFGEEFSSHPKKTQGEEFSGEEFSDEEYSDEKLS
jgi:hypothetical protein